MRSVWNRYVWVLHLICRKEISVKGARGDKTTRIDLGIRNYIAIDYKKSISELAPGNILKEAQYFTKPLS